MIKPPSLLAQTRSLSQPARLFLIATLLDGAVFSVWGLFFNFYILERGFDRQFLGLVTTTVSLAALLLGLPLGSLSDRMGRKRAMLVGVVIYVAGAAVEVLAISPTIILAGAFLNGAGGTLYFLSQAPFMMKVSTPQNRTLLFSLNFGLITLVGAVSNLLAGQLPAWFGQLLGAPPTSATAYQAVLLLAVGLSTLTLIPLSLLKEPGSGSQAGEEALLEAVDAPGTSGTAVGTNLERPSIWQVVKQALTIKLALPNMMIGLGAAILIPYMNLYFRDRYDISDQLLGVLFSLSALLTGVGSILAPRLAHSMGGKIPAIVFTQGFSLIFLIVLGFTPFLWLAGAAFLLRGVLMNMSVPLYSAFAMERVPENQRATVNSFKELAWQIGWAVGPYISGVVQESYGFTPLFVTTSILYGLSILTVWRFFGRGE